MTHESRYENLGKILQNLPKEKLSQDFDERFWKRFSAQAKRPGGHPVGLVLAVMGAVTIFMVVRNFYLEKPSAEIVQGPVMIQSGPKGSPVPLVPKRALTKGDRLKTGESGWVMFELENGYQIQLNPNSEIVVKELKSHLLPGKTVFDLRSGHTLVSIGGPHHARYPLEVLTPNAFARAMGTQFIVSAPSGSNPESGIRVLNGTVHVGRIFDVKAVRDSQRSVTAGEEIQISSDSKDLSIQRMAEETRFELEEFFQFSHRNRAILLIGMGPNRFRDLLRPCAIYLRIHSVDENVRAVAAIARDIQEAVEEDDKAKHLAAVTHLEGAIEEQKELNPVPLLLFTGAYYNALGEYQDAARIFGDISLRYPRSGYASLALMAEAVIQKEKLGNPEKAKSLAHEILTRYPGSYEATEAARF